MVTSDKWEYCFSKLQNLHPICDQMTREEINTLMEKGTLVSFRPGALISMPGRPARAVYIIMYGSVLVSRNPTWGGDHRIYIARRQAGTFVGEVTGSSLLRDHLDPLADTKFAFTGMTRAETHCEMLQMTHEEFRALLEKGGTFAVNVVRCMAIKVLEASNRMEFLKHRSAVSRIADELLHLWEQQNHSAIIQIPMQMKEFAWWLDLEPPTLSRALKNMEKADLIDYHSTRRINKDHDAETGKIEIKRQNTITIKDIEALRELREHDNARFI